MAFDGIAIIILFYYQPIPIMRVFRSLRSRIPIPPSQLILRWSYVSI